MTVHGITYIGYSKDEFGYYVKFDINGITYEYEIAGVWVDKIEQISRHSEAKALQIARQYGIVVNKEKREGEENVTKRKVDNSGNTSEQSEVRPRRDGVRSTDTDQPGSSVARPIVNETIRKARRIVQGE